MLWSTTRHDVQTGLQHGRVTTCHCLQAPLSTLKQRTRKSIQLCKIKARSAQQASQTTVVTRTQDAWPLRTVRKAGCAYLQATVRLSMCHQKETRDESTQLEKITACSAQQAHNYLEVFHHLSENNGCETNATACSADSKSWV